MLRIAVFACLLAASLCLPSGADAAKKLPAEVSFDDFVAFLQKAVGDDVEVREGIIGYVATSGEVSIGWIGRPLEGKTGEALLAEALDLMQAICDKPTLQLSAIA